MFYIYTFSNIFSPYFYLIFGVLFFVESHRVIDKFYQNVFYIDCGDNKNVISIQ